MSYGSGVPVESKGLDRVQVRVHVIWEWGTSEIEGFRYSAG